MVTCFINVISSISYIWNIFYISIQVSYLKLIFLEYLSSMYSSFLVTFTIFGIFFRCVFKFTYIFYICYNCALRIQVHLFSVMYSELLSPTYSCVLVAFHILGTPCVNICGPHHLRVHAGGQ